MPNVKLLSNDASRFVLGHYKVRLEILLERWNSQEVELVVRKKIISSPKYLKKITKLLTYNTTTIINIYNTTIISYSQENIETKTSTK